MTPTTLTTPATFGSTAVRPATEADAAALHALSHPFMRTGELRTRTPADYRAAAGQFLLAPGPDGPDGCIALRPLAPEAGHPAAGALYNFCVRPGRQGTGLGSHLLQALLATAARHGLRTICAATTGDGRLFTHFGFVQVPAARAPQSWAAGLDPARGSKVYLRTVPGSSA